MFSKANLLAVHERITAESRALMQAKNDDYAHGDDAFKNFRRHGSFGVLVRLSDKIARLESFEARGDFKVQSESLEDTVKDIVNYAAIYLGMKLEAGAAKPEFVGVLPRSNVGIAGVCFGESEDAG